jgi:RNA polymerase sigma-70 factor (ECF subfamily)
MSLQHTNQHDTASVVADIPTTDDHCFLQYLAQGDTTAFWALWEHYRETLLSRRCLQWMGGNEAEAEDALSSACLKAWQKLPAYAHDIHNVKGWFLQLLHNHCMDIHCEHTRHDRTVEFDDDYASRDIAGDAMQAPESPENAVLRYETHTAIQRALAHLPARLREPAMLRFCQEQSHRDIAVQLCLTPETTRKRIQQARTLLQKQLRAYLDGANGSRWLDDEPLAAASNRTAREAMVSTDPTHR